MSADLMAEALAALASLPPDMPLGVWRAPDGSWGDSLTCDDVSVGLLEGIHRPEDILRAVDLARRLNGLEP